MTTLISEDYAPLTALQRSQSEMLQSLGLPPMAADAYARITADFEWDEPLDKRLQSMAARCAWIGRFAGWDAERIQERILMPPSEYLPLAEADEGNPLSDHINGAMAYMRLFARGLEEWRGR